MIRKLILATGTTLALVAPANAQLPDLTAGHGGQARHRAGRAQGRGFGTWSVPANQTVQPPLMDLVDCPPGTDTNTCDHNEYADPAVDTAHTTPCRARR